RSLSQSLGVHRNTVVKALEELQAIGWIEIIPNKGAFVVESLPVSNPSNWQEKGKEEHSGKEAFSFYEYPELSPPYSFEHPLSFDDGLPDIVCTNFQSETTSVYVQHRDGYFIERSDEIGVGRTARQRLSFGVDFFDADNDGDDDLLVANGHIYTQVAEFKTGTSFGQPNTLYERQKDGFVDVTRAAGPALQLAQPTRGLATGDLDQDGDLDFIMVNNDIAADVSRNTTHPIGNSILLWLEGEATNRSAIGAIVTAKAGELEVTAERVGASSYLSGCAPHIHLGLGAAAEADEVMVTWPGGQTQRVRGLAAGHVYHWRENQEPIRVRPFAGTSRTEP
ncbi:MAG: ASPIC/UnbV domain-containing protein, partial [Planctomycetota bacterium]